ncbi:hypothetical protein MBLNU13_g08536t3 [Cladosporium sp. NU13]
MLTTASYDYDSIVTVLVGAGEKRFTVHKDTNDLVLDNTALEVEGDCVVEDPVELYLLSDVLDDVKLRNKTLRSLTEEIKRSRVFLNPEQCHRIWQHTSTNCSIQKWVVDHLVSLLAPKVFQEHATEYPGGLVLKLAVILMNRYVKGQRVDWKALEVRVENYMEAEGGA